MKIYDDRLREHPELRFAEEVQLFDLGRAATELGNEPSGQHGHKQKALFRRGPMTVGLWLFDKDGCLPGHVLDGSMVVQVIEGLVKLRTDGGEQELRPGQFLVIGPNVRHDICAVEPSRVLMTFCLEKCES